MYVCMYIYHLDILSTAVLPPRNIHVRTHTYMYMYEHMKHVHV